jgi:hypothetical protein
MAMARREESLLPLASKAAGAAFSAFISSKFGESVGASNLSLVGFSLLVAFGRCRFRLEEAFVASSLSTILGCSGDALSVCSLEDRIFLFSVSCKLVGFEVYKIRSFSCEEFELSFHLLNNAGLAAARLKASGQPKQFPWIQAGKKPSYADMVKSRNVVLTGANKQKIGSKPLFANSAFRSSSRAQKNRIRNLCLIESLSQGVLCLIV